MMRFAHLLLILMGICSSMAQAQDADTIVLPAPANPGAPVAPQIPPGVLQSQPLSNPNVPPAQSGVITNSRDLDKKVAGRVKAPFMLPNHIYIKLKRKQGNIEGEGFVDESVEPQRRWALRNYTLVGIIWNVSRPKAMITDKQGALHMFYVKDKIGNNEGQITAIHNGEVVISEKGSETRLRLGR